MNSSDGATARVEPFQRLAAAGELQIEQDPGLPPELVADDAKQQIVAQCRVQQFQIGLDRPQQFEIELVRQRLGFGKKACQHAFLGPQEALTELGQPRRLPLPAGQQRVAQQRLLGLQGTPQVAVGNAQRRRRPADRPLLTNRTQ